MCLIKLDYCSKIFSRGNTVIHAMRPTVMELEKGIHVIYGRDGAGKSTLLHMMAGMEPPSDGKSIMKEHLFTMSWICLVFIGRILHLFFRKRI